MHHCSAKHLLGHLAICLKSKVWALWRLCSYYKKAGQQGLGLRWRVACLDIINVEKEKKIYLSQEGLYNPRVGRGLQTRYFCLHYQPLNEVEEKGEARDPPRLVTQMHSLNLRSAELVLPSLQGNHWFKL